MKIGYPKFKQNKTSVTKRLKKLLKINNSSKDKNSYILVLTLLLKLKNSHAYRSQLPEEQEGN